MHDLVNRLGRVSHFRDLPVSALHAIIAAGCIRRFPAGGTIFGECETCAGMFVLLSGRVHLCKPGPQGQEQIISVIDPVIMFNEVAVLDGGVNPTTAVAVKDSFVWQISHESFHKLAQQYPAVGLGLLRVLAARNRALISRCEDLSYRSVQARLAKQLLDLSQNGRLPVDRRENSIRHIAALIGTVPELVSRYLKSLKEAELIELNRAVITVSRPEALAELAQIPVQGG